jgi:uncharacterized protein
MSNFRTRKTPELRSVIVLLIIGFIEIYFLQAVKTFARDFKPRTRKILLYTALALAVISMALALTSLFYPPQFWSRFWRFIMGTMVPFIVCKALAAIVLLLDDLFRGIRWIYIVLNTKRKKEKLETRPKISRLKFMSQIAVALTVIPAVGFLYGIIRGAYRYRIHNVKIPSPNLPDAFHGYKIVQISDIHTGSFMDTSALSKAFDIVLQQKPDLILFTGDLVNNIADETKGFEEVYRKLKAPHGVYSVLGNHDYGDYWAWNNMEDKKRNLDNLKKVHADSGWRLLLNEHVAIEKDGEKIALIGVENWGGNMHFPKYGKMNRAYSGTEQYPFKILMSHDPSHWEKQVQKEYRDVDLTLSGHTHGFQFGIEIPGFKWSPVKYFYRQWAGLYKQDNQFLYVNRGLGFLGYPGRLGIWPEITVLELQKA